jgi:hypothetical protein
VPERRRLSRHEALLRRFRNHMRRILTLEDMTGEEAAEWLREHGSGPEARAFHRRLTEWRRAGLSDEEIVDAILTAR